jgi:outer membrane immunogenic protein
MKSLLWLVAAAVALTAASLASAADLPLPTKAPATQAVYNWTGFYVGANFGGGWSRSAVSGSATSALTGVGVFPETFAGNINSSGVLGGGQIGFNYEFPSNWVVGIEADIDGSGIAGATNTCATILATGAVAACETSSSRLNDFGTVRGRAGYALNNVLLYGTGGLAWDQNSITHTATCVGAACPGASLPFVSNNPSLSSSAIGWAAGAGAEWAFFRNWTFRLEYLHLEFDGVTTNYTFTGSVAGFPFTTASHTSSNTGVDIVRVGVNYLFN